MYNDKDLILQGELWKDIPGYEGIYQASNLGRIKGIDGRKTHSTRHGERCWKERILKPKSRQDKSGYRVTLWKEKTPKDFLVARLVCMTFYGKSCLTVNHKDGNRLNNNIENLEWLSLADNVRHAFETGLVTAQVCCALSNEKETKKFRSLAQASRYLGHGDQYLSNAIKRKIAPRNKDGVAYEVLIKVI